MKSLKELYRIGIGPSSSHTMGPRLAAEAFRQTLPANVAGIRVHLFGSLAATGRGHLTDIAVTGPFSPLPVEIVWAAHISLPRHPNGMRFEALDAEDRVVRSYTAFSIGGGALAGEVADSDAATPVYPYAALQEILAVCEREALTLPDLVIRNEGGEILDFLRNIWRAMQGTVDRGLAAEGVLPGALGLKRRAKSYYAKAEAMNGGGPTRQTAMLFAYALAVSEENAGGGEVVTAPTCGSCGVLPSVLYFARHHQGASDEAILRALATAGLIGNLVKRNASISGAEVGCQGEVGTACAMAAAAATQLLGGSLRQIEYAAEMGLEHHLGLTCDPIDGFVQIPCIERNAMAAVRAVDCATYALLSDGGHVVSFDDVVRTMWETGRDLGSGYRETAQGGLAKVVRLHRPG